MPRPIKQEQLRVNFVDFNVLILTNTTEEQKSLNSIVQFIVLNNNKCTYCNSNMYQSWCFSVLFLYSERTGAFHKNKRFQDMRITSFIKSRLSIPAFIVTLF